MRYLITGGAGFIGSNLVDKLVSQGHEVIVVDDLSTGDLENIDRHLTQERIEFYNCRAGESLSKALGKLDGIFHLGIPSTTEIYRNDNRLITVAVDDFISIMKLAQQNNCKVVYASSSSLYNGQNPPHKETMQVKVKDFYTEARYFCERLALLWHDFYGVSSIGCRFFSVYGIRERHKGHFANLVSQFLWAIEKGEEIVVYGDGTQTRDFTFVDDICNGLISAMDSELVSCGIFNLGSETSYTINTMISELEKATGRKANVVYKHNPLKNYVQDTLADTSAAKNVLKWQAYISLDDGIKKLVEFYKK